MIHFFHQSKREKETDAMARAAGQRSGPMSFMYKPPPGLKVKWNEAENEILNLVVGIFFCFRKWKREKDKQKKKLKLLQNEKNVEKQATCQKKRKFNIAGFFLVLNNGEDGETDRFKKPLTRDEIQKSHGLGKQTRKIILTIFYLLGQAPLAGDYAKDVAVTLRPFGQIVRHR